MYKWNEKKKNQNSECWAYIHHRMSCHSTGSWQRPWINLCKCYKLNHPEFPASFQRAVNWWWGLWLLNFQLQFTKWHRIWWKMLRGKKNCTEKSIRTINKWTRYSSTPFNLGVCWIMMSVQWTVFDPMSHFIALIAAISARNFTSLRGSAYFLIATQNVQSKN